ncbi:MFS transporter [Streptomyces sp. TG1A-8]|uniref:MFS transporter n=1 Tax=Streptomyces sp. TG1A-8 TaxID=3051385 RepID=UPI00265BE7E2|nr:MFS transporter [Streptomyces sp. TG1A-8]MDO0924211.1 MFS transporter [Streptomyces sp. TG1A-8]
MPDPADGPQAASAAVPEAPTGAPASAPHVAGTTVVSAFCVFFVLGALTASLGASLPYLKTEFGSGHAVGRIVSCYNFGALAATALIGLLGRRARPRPTITLLLAVFAAATAGMALSPGWASYLCATTVAGAGYGGMVLTLNTAFARGFGHNSVIMVNRLNAVFGVGAILGPLATGPVGRTDIRLLALAACLLALPCILVRRMGVVLEQPASARTGGARPRLGRPSAVLVLFLVTGLLYAGLETSIGAWQSTHLQRSGWSLAAATMAASGFWAGMALGRLVVPQLTARLPAGTTVPLYLVSALGALLLAAVPHLAMAAYPLAGLCLAPVLPTVITWTSGVADVPQRATSVLTLCCMLGNATVPAVVEGLTDTRPPAAIPLTLAGFCALCLLFATLARRARRPGRL